MQVKNYNIIKSLERNTLSELFLARHVHENYYVKIRLYDQFSITNEEIREAILQRLRNSYQMRHRNIIATLDYGVDGRYMYQIQEHMDHGTLEDVLDKVSAIPPEIAAFILQEILRGLRYAHSIGIFHGMLNPSKVLFSSNGIVKLDDFQFLDLKNTFLKQIQTRAKARQQMYLAPEHLLGKEADHRCDLFSAGVMAYRMLSGRHPFLEEKSEWTVMQIIACNAKLLFELNPTLPSDIEELVEKMIEKEVGQRTQSAEEVLRVVEAYIDGFGEVRSYEVLANFLKKPGSAVDQLNHLRAEEVLQQAAQLQLQEQWDKALIAYYRAQFLKPRDKNIENEIRSLRAKGGYPADSGDDPKLHQLEQTLRANPENIQVLQRLATLAKSRGDLLETITYHKKILKLHPRDIFASVQLKELLETRDRDIVFSPNEVKWTRWQEFYRKPRRAAWDRWTALHGNLSLLSAVLVLGLVIALLDLLHLNRYGGVVSAAPPSIPSQSSALIANQKTDRLCESALQLHRQGRLKDAIEILSKAPVSASGSATARARLLLARFRIEADQMDAAMAALDAIDIPSAKLDQKIEIYRLKADIYKSKGQYGYSIDQFITIQTLPGVSSALKSEADAKIQAIQEEALQQLEQ